MSVRVEMAASTTTPLEPAPPERDVLLATKLHVPRPRPGFVPRPHLLEQLSKGTASGLILVCAPAGFGKTSVLAEWARCRPQPVAWLSLDLGDSDPARFWRYVAAALDRLRPGIASRVAALLSGPQQPPLEAVLTAVVNELTGVGEETVLVLDDYHLVEDPAVHGSLAMLLERLPPQLRLVLASRADPSLPLARLRASGQLSELRERDLRFTATETAALLREATGLDLPAGTVAALEARTEGWVAGLQLAALSLRGHADPAGFVATFSGSHRFVLDYLTEEILARQPEELVRFLLETSVLERLSGPLCDAVCGRGDSQRLLEQVERANLFLVPLDEERRWWRYHHLFADLLRARLQQADPARVTALHRAATAWCEKHGLADDAVRHALAAGQVTSAARIVEQHADELLLRSERATLQRWLDRLPAELAGARPRLLLARARLALHGGDLEAVEGPLDAAERAFAVAAAEAEEPYEPSVGRAASLLANIPAIIALERAWLAELRGDPEATTAFAERAQAELGEGEWMLESVIRWEQGVAGWLRGELVEAERAFVASADRWSAAGEAALAAWACQYLGQLQRDQGRLDAALGTYRRALEVVATAGRPDPPSAGIAQVGMAEVAYQRSELDAALRHLTEGIALCRQLTYTQPLATGLATLAWIRQAAGDAAGALEAIEEAARVAPSPGVASLLNPVPALRARLALAHGDRAAAARWTDERGLSADDQPSYPREPEYLVLARVLLAQQAPQRALGLLERLHALAAAQARAGSVIEVLALQALALAAAGDHERALAALAEALRLAAPEGYLRVFLDEGAPMAALLGRLATNPAKARAVTATPLARAHLDRLIQAFARHGLPVLARPRPGGAMAPGLVEPLSARELEVLGLLADGRSNQGIASELVISLDTVKRHVSHVLDKLGAANRTQAVGRARDLGLLR
jgi:LuxR family transcriptional regulator, maltose regulon positive regulatory protein